MCIQSLTTISHENCKIKIVHANQGNYFGCFERKLIRITWVSGIGFLKGFLVMLRVPVNSGTCEKTWSIV